MADGSGGADCAGRCAGDCGVEAAGRRDGPPVHLNRLGPEYRRGRARRYLSPRLVHPGDPAPDSGDHGSSGAFGLQDRLEFTIAHEGNFYVEVTDARSSTQARNFYRLKMGAYRYAEGIFPRGGRRGAQVPVTFFGGRAGTGVQTTVDLRQVGP